LRLYMGLIHFPVYNKNYERIASAITTLDIHDLARLAKTYGVRRLFIVTPLDDQQNLTRRILRHWIDGYGGQYNRHRKEALELVCVVPDLERAVEEIKETEGEAPLIIATDARPLKNAQFWSRSRKAKISTTGISGIFRGLKFETDAEIGQRGAFCKGLDASDENDRSMSYEKARGIIQEDKAVILLFGTAWGLHEEVMNKTDSILDPVSGKTGYNHLSVRTAAAIILDRLAGEI